MSSQIDQTMTLSTVEIVQKAAQAIDNKKGKNILAIDVRGKSNLTDIILIAEGSIERHVTAIAKEVIMTLKEEGIEVFREEGLQEGSWVVLDYVHFMVHILTPTLRQYYQIERIWPGVKLIDLKLDK